ncbi:hypothetical protein ACFQH6_18830 [Halobacteriaceae archaeon GCM10025711]
MTDTSNTAERALSIEPGDVVYTEDGDALGVVSGFTDDGVEVDIPEDDEPVGSDVEPGPGTADRETKPGQEFGEGYLMWRCDECGEMGDLEAGLPEACPNCGAPKNALYRTQED